MRFHIAHYGFLAPAAVVIIGCSPDRATAPNVNSREINGPAADLVGLTETPVLYNQYSGFTISSDGGNAGETNYLADDFTVPADTVWTVSQVGITGYLFTALTFSIRADADGHPGAVVPNTDVSLTASASHSFGIPGIANHLFTLPTAITLPAGKYWLTILTSGPDVSSPIAWLRHRQVNSSGVRSQDGVTWQSLGTDYVFAVFGTAMLTQTITFAPLPTTAAIGSTVTLDATASSGLTVSFSAAPTSVCNVSGTTLNLVGAGACAVTATQPGNPTGNPAYEPAEMVTRNIFVVKASQSITFPAITPNPATVSGSATLGATASSGLAVSYSSLTPNVCTVSGTTVSYDNVGTCTVAADQAGNGSYDAARQATQSVEVAKAIQTIAVTSTAPAPAYVKGTSAVAATGGASGKAVAITVGPSNVCTVTDNVVRFVGVGICTVTANQAGNAAYEAAAPVSQSVKVDYRFEGFLDPVKNGGVLNTAKVGQTITLKWRLTDANGAPVTTLTSAVISAKELSCSIGGSGSLLEEAATGGSGLQNLGDGYYQLNWKTPASYARSCKTLHLDLGEGSGTRSASFAFTK